MVAGSELSECIVNLTLEQRKAILSSGHGRPELVTSLFRPLKEVFDKWGFVLVRGVLDDESLGNLCKAGEVMAQHPAHVDSFAALEFGPVFSTEEDTFRAISLGSAIPAIIAKLLETKDAKCGEEQDPSCLRVLKDAFFAKGREEKHCGWHVDDSFFWPTDGSSCGVNVWLALDEIPSKYGGGLAVAPKSHVAQWRQKAYEVIGSVPTLSAEGITPSSSANYAKTCEMANLDRGMNGQIEASKVVFDYRPGDCLFCNRWLFHRSVPINSDGRNHYADGSALKRYTIRYERGDARLLGGMNMEACVLTNPANAGKTLDEVCGSDGPFYPKCWPPLSQHAKMAQVNGMKELARGKLALAQLKKREIMQARMAMRTKDKAEE